VWEQNEVSACGLIASSIAVENLSNPRSLVRHCVHAADNASESKFDGDSSGKDALFESFQDRLLKFFR
jgi:hypothetical protein